MAGQETDGDRRRLLDLLRRYLEEEFGCHTAILYGSRARGDWEATSDIDVFAFRDAGETGQLAHRWQGLFLDLFLYPTATRPDPDWLRLHGGQVLFQRGSGGDEVLAAVEAMFAAGSKPLSAGDARTRRLTNAARRPRKYLRADEVAKLMAAARSRNGRYAHRDATMILIAYRTACARPSSPACWDMLDLPQGRLHVSRLKNGRPSVHTVRGNPRHNVSGGLCGPGEMR